MGRGDAAPDGSGSGNTPIRGQEPRTRPRESVDIVADPGTNGNTASARLPEPHCNYRYNTDARATSSLLYDGETKTVMGREVRLLENTCMWGRWESDVMESEIANKAVVIDRCA